MNLDPMLLFHYTDWANDRVIEGARQLTTVQLHLPIRDGFVSTLGLLVHLLAAERLWLSRLQGLSPKTLITEDLVPTLDTLVTAWEPIRAERFDYLAGIGDGQRDIVYSTTKGVECRDVLWHLILHLVNHHTEHRSQLAFYLAMQGIDVGNLDLIYYVRDGLHSGS